jgi:hypothetical protein
MDAIQAIADKYGLKVIYDAAHAFGVEVNGESVLTKGDMSTLSFHATKVYNTLEGGALIVKDEATKKRIDYLKNFGFAGETEVVAPGINSKVDEVRSAYGLLNLKQVDAAIEARHLVAIKYREALRDVPGIRFFDDMPDVRHNYSYFPIFVNADEYGMTRDELYFKMKEQGVLGRRYFFPLISTFSTYRGLPSAAPENLPVAGIPLDLTRGLKSARDRQFFGWEDDTGDEDFDSEVDHRLRNNMVMKGSKSVNSNDGPERGINDSENIRRIMWRGTMDPDKTYYMKMKSVLDSDKKEFYMDYFEYCAKEVYDNPIEAEDLW